jgi:hypothetical protein
MRLPNVYGLRKFLLAGAALVGGFVLAYSDKNVLDYSIVAASVLGLYSGANVWSKRNKERLDGDSDAESSGY